MLGLGLSSWQAAARLRAGPQAVLGAALLGWWDAARTDRMVLAGSNVTSWADLVAGAALTQSVSGAKPLWTLDEGGRPMVLFDGTDDYLEQAANHPFGSGAFELWLVASNLAPAADQTSRWAIGIGATAAAGIGRNAPGGTNRARGAFGGNGSSVGYGDFTGSHVVRLRGEAAQAWITFDGGAPLLLGNLAPVGAGRIRMGCLSGSLSGFWQGAVHAVLVTALLSDTQAAQMLRWCKDRGGIA